MREIQMPPKRSEKLKELKERKKMSAREQRREDRNLNEKDKMYKKNNKRFREHQKKELKSSMKLQAELLRRNAAHGEGSINQRAEDPRNDSYFKDTPLNVCNICARIFNSIKGKETHVKDTLSHDAYELPCTSKDRCGGLFLNECDLTLHKEITGH